MKTTCIAFIVLLSSTAFAVPAQWDVMARSDVQSATLADIEQQVTAVDNPVVIFDLDATLYNNYGRTAAIFREYAAQSDVAELSAVQGTQFSQGFVLEEILTTDLGIAADRASAIMATLSPFWKDRFFTNDYIKYDTALPGAVEYVRSLYKKGAYVLYVTGRYNDSMRSGTIQRMKRDGFPINTDRTQLIMKPGSIAAANAKTEKQFNKNITSSDANYKEVATATARKLGTIVATFENSSKQIQNYYRDLHAQGQGRAVWLKTEMHPGESAPTTEGITAIRGFLK